MFGVLAVINTFQLFYVFNLRPVRPSSRLCLSITQNKINNYMQYSLTHQKTANENNKVSPESTAILHALYYFIFEFCSLIPLLSMYRLLSFCNVSHRHSSLDFTQLQRCKISELQCPN